MSCSRRIGKRYTNKRVEDACKRALLIGSRRVRSVRSILDAGPRKQAIEAEAEPVDPILLAQVGKGRSSFQPTEAFARLYD